jgi:hypothetical protein
MQRRRDRGYLSGVLEAARADAVDPEALETLPAQSFGRSEVEPRLPVEQGPLD